MSSSTIVTALPYIDSGFPVQGADNSSQGFRDNFFWIKQAFNNAAADINDLYAAGTSLGTTSTFGILQVGLGLDAVIPGVITLNTATSTSLGGIKLGEGFLSDGLGLTTLSAATTSTIGGVKVGTGLTIDGHGILSVGSVLVTTATSTTLGGVKLGIGIRAEGDGTINVDNFATPATTSSLGGVIVGSNINVDSSGTISVTALDWANITGTPAFAAVSTSGSYLDLSNRPFIPTLVSSLTNDYGYITTSSVTWNNLIGIPNLVTYLGAGSDITLSANTGSIVISAVSNLQTVTSRGSTTNRPINITDNTVSTSETTGALTVNGGVGVNGNINVAGTFTANTIRIGIAAAGSVQSANDLYLKSYGPVRIVTNAAATATIWNFREDGVVELPNVSELRTLSTLTEFRTPILVTGGIQFNYASDQYLNANISGVNISTNMLSTSSQYQWSFDKAGRIVLPIGGDIVDSNFAPIFQNKITTLVAGTDTALSTATGISSSTGIIYTVWNTSTLQSVTGRGATTNAAVSITNTTPSTTSTNGALVVTGGVGIGANLNVAGITTFGGPVTFNGTATYVLSTNTIYTDNIIELHIPPGGVNSLWNLNDGKDIGLRFHYYTASTDTNAALVLANDSKYLEWYSSGAESNTGTFAGSTYGTFKTGSIQLTNTTSATSTSTGALTVVGGVGVGGSLYTTAAYDNNSRVVTTATIGLYGVTKLTGTTALAVSTSTGSVTLTNLGVTQLTGTTALAISASTGSITLTNLGVTSLAGSTYLAVSTSTGSVTLTNLGVQTLTAGTDTVVSSSTGTVTVWNNSTLQSVTGRGATTNAALSITNSTGASNTNSGALQVTGGLGVGGNVYATAIYDNNSRVITVATLGSNGVTSLTGTTALAVSASTGSVTLTNLGVTQLSGTTALAVSASTGSITLTNLGVTSLAGSTYLAVSGSTGSVTLTNLGVTNLISGTDITLSATTGSITINDASTLQTVTGRGASTTNAVSVTNSTNSTSTTTGALKVTGGVGIGGNLVVGGQVNTPNRTTMRVYGTTSGDYSFPTVSTLTNSQFTVDYNVGGALNVTTGIFTAQTSGTYITTLTARVPAAGTGTNQIAVLKNDSLSSGNSIAFWESNTNTGATHFSVSGQVYLNINDTLRAKLLLGKVQFDSNDNWTVTFLG